MGNPSQSYGESPAIWDHTITWQQTQVSVPCHNPRHTSEGWKAELNLVLVICRDGLHVRRQSPIQVVITRWQIPTWPGV